MRYFSSKLIILFVSILTIQCGKGIEPEPEKQPEGFGGTVYFAGEWPQNVTRTHIVVFKNPLVTPADFNALNLAYVSMEIPYGVQEFNYSTLDSAIFPVNIKLQAGTYSYLAVAQQTTPVITLSRADWYVAGFYSAGNDSLPGTVTFSPGQYRDQVNIFCDFNAPPPQPPDNEL
jgi:hypothetical protein